MPIARIFYCIFHIIMPIARIFYCIFHIIIMQACVALFSCTVKDCDLAAVQSVNDCDLAAVQSVKD